MIGAAMEHTSSLIIRIREWLWGIFDGKNICHNGKIQKRGRIGSAKQVTNWSRWPKQYAMNVVTKCLVILHNFLIMTTCNLELYCYENDNWYGGRCRRISAVVTRQTWMWLKESGRYFCKIEYFAYGEINERGFNNPHPSKFLERSHMIHFATNNIKCLETHDHYHSAQSWLYCAWLSHGKCMQGTWNCCERHHSDDCRL